MSMRTRDRRRRERQRITMVEFKWIQMSLFLIALLHFTAAERLLTVRVGDDVTLPCEHVIDGQQNCEYTTWLFSASGNTAVALFELGRIKNTSSKSDRLSVTANCSLVIKKVTVEDVGLYTCRQFISGQQQGPDSQVYLSVINLTEHKDSDKVTLSCSVSTYEPCTHTVKWLNGDQDLDKDNQEMKISQSPCKVSLHFLSSHFIYTSNYTSLKCAVTDGNKEQQFPFRLQPSAEKPGEDTKPAIKPATKPTPKPTTIATTTIATTTSSTIRPTKKPTTTESSTKAGTNRTESPINNTSTELKACTDWSVLNYIMLVMRVAELLLITVITVLLIRARGNQRPPDDSTVLNSVRSRAVRRSGPAASQVNNDEEEDDGVVKYENFGETSSVSLH